ncbi:MAG: MFS transporter [Propionibacteriales bacterium]|nr:MFS transporter [Propionibacteriales bacterium]
MRKTGVTGRWRARRPAPWFIRLLVVTLFLHIAVNLFRPMVSYRALELGVAPRYLGLISAAFAVVPLVVGITVGRLVDREGPRQLHVFLGSVLLGIGGLGLGLVGSLAGVVVLFAICGLGHLLVAIAMQTMISHQSSADALDRRFGYFTFAGSAGQLVGPLLGGLVAPAAGEHGPAGRSPSAAWWRSWRCRRCSARPWRSWCCRLRPGCRPPSWPWCWPGSPSACASR